MRMFLLAALWLAMTNAASAEMTSLTCTMPLSPHAQHLKIDENSHRIQQSSTGFETGWLPARFTDGYIRWKDDAGNTYTLDRYTGTLVLSDVTVHWHCVVLSKQF
jgi:hypothetical protein